MPKKKADDRIKENIRYLEGVKEEIDALPRIYRGVGTVAAA
jgi:hypothetical protein